MLLHLIFIVKKETQVFLCSWLLCYYLISVPFFGRGENANSLGKSGPNPFTGKGWAWCRPLTLWRRPVWLEASLAWWLCCLPYLFPGQPFRASCRFLDVLLFHTFGLQTSCFLSLNTFLHCMKWDWTHLTIASSFLAPQIWIRCASNMLLFAFYT